MSSRFHSTLGFIIFLITIIKCIPDTTVQDAECSLLRWTTDDPYGSLVGELFSDLPINTVSQPRYQYYASYTDEGETTTAYGFASCSTTLSAVDCMNCLGSAVQYLRDMCPLAVGARVLMIDCFMRYENYPFYGTN